MKWSWMFSASVALSGMMGSAEAGLFGLGGCKSCGCAEDCQPAVCKPTIARPCHTNVYTYQRKCSDIKPPCCDDGCGVDGGCGPVSCSAPADLNGNGCGNGAADPGCQAPAGCAVDPNCAAPAGDPSCAAPCGDPSCAAPAGDPSCAAPAGDPSCAAPCGDPSCAAPSCAVPAGEGCVVDPSCAAPAGEGCDTTCGEGCDEDACEIAKLIYTSMTDCYAKNRRNALDELGDYDCACHPEIMNAFVYGLNDTDERVRREAADEIGDAVRSNSCCCSPTTVAALTLLWLTATAVFVTRLKKLWKLAVTKLSTETATAARTDVQTVPAVPFTRLLLLLKLQPQPLRLLKLFRLRLLQLSHRPSSHHGCIASRLRRPVWQVCSE